MLDYLLVVILSLVLFIPLIIIVATVDRSDIKAKGNYPGSIFNLIPCSDTALGYGCCSSIIVVVAWEVIFTGTERSVYATPGSQWFFDVIIIMIIALVIGHVCGAPLRLITKPGAPAPTPQRSIVLWCPKCGMRVDVKIGEHGVCGRCGYVTEVAEWPQSYADPPPPSILLWCPKCQVRLEVKIGERGVCDRCGYVTEVAEWPP